MGHEYKPEPVTKQPGLNQYKALNGTSILGMFKS